MVTLLDAHPHRLNHQCVRLSRGNFRSNSDVQVLHAFILQWLAFLVLCCMLISHQAVRLGHVGKWCVCQVNADEERFADHTCQFASDCSLVRFAKLFWQALHSGHQLCSFPLTLRSLDEIASTCSADSTECFRPLRIDQAPKYNLLGSTNMIADFVM